jgi:hypothetical protein
VDRSNLQWIVRDPDSNLWTSPASETCGGAATVFQPTEDTELEPVPGITNM